MSLNERDFQDLDSQSPKSICKLVATALAENFSFRLLHDHDIAQICEAISSNRNAEGSDLIAKLFAGPLIVTRNWPGYVKSFQGSLLEFLLAEPSSNQEEAVGLTACYDALIKEADLKDEPKRKLEVQSLQLRHDHNPHFHSDRFWKTLTDTSKVKRDLAIAGLAKSPPNDLLDKSSHFLSAKKSDTRISIANLLGEIKDPAACGLLVDALEKEKSEKVLTALHAALAACGQDSPDAEREIDYNEFLKSGTKLKLPKATWLNLAELSDLPTGVGTPLPTEGLTFLIAKQAKHKAIEASPEVQPLLSHLDLEKSSPFALALYQQWLASEQAAKDRWVLTLAGLLGGQKIIPELMAPINDWALNSRHKLAEYAAQAIALVPGDEALTILDSLANRYRSKFKNIGKACRAALEEAAVSRGVSLDELADLIVPTLGFNEEGQRPLEDSNVEAVLQPDFKLSFYNPDTEKETKSPPASLSETAKEDLKALRKLIRETIKGQTARLEGCLVRQRRWNTTRWQELFENHPLLQTYANNLVWATYEKSSKLKRTFRRYPNGLLANAEGELIEFEKDETQIGMVHPLELSAEDLLAWQQHLERMKVKPPFPQLDRPVALLDTNHGNRKELKTADKKSLSCGTFRSRAEKRGWQRGSVVDAGGIWYYYKSYQGAGVDVFLHVEEMWVGQDPMDRITLGTAMFVQGDSVHVGSYEYNEPRNTDDPRVLAFGKVPPIVYSETVTDLQAITS